ncbi:MAG: hypothetical protein ACLGI3_10720, partial [Actinomycetes bacterium]
MLETSAAASAPAPVARCWTLVDDEGAVDVEVTASDTDTVGTVLPALARQLQVPVHGLWAGTVALRRELPLTAPA